MNIEESIFKNLEVNEKKLLKYGFIKDDNKYVYSTKILDDNFEIIVEIKKGKVSSKIIDCSFDVEYILHRVESANGEFVNIIRNALIKNLEDIRNNCFIINTVKNKQVNRIIDKIYTKYNDKPDYPWKDETSAVIRNPNNNKWYALIMNINKSFFDMGDGKIDILNVKLDPEKITKLIDNPGYKKAYHMNKKNWITIILDDTLTDDEIMKQVDESHTFTLKK